MDRLCCQFHLPPPVVGWVGPSVSVGMVAYIGTASVWNLTHSHSAVDVVKSTASMEVIMTIVFKWNTYEISVCVCVCVHTTVRWTRNGFALVRAMAVGFSSGFTFLVYVSLCRRISGWMDGWMDEWLDG